MTLQKNIYTTENLGLAGSSVRSSLKSGILEIVSKALPKLPISRKSGRGLMSYDGSQNEDGSIFIGTNKKLDTNILVFTDEKGLEALDKFRNDFLNLEENQDIANEIKVCAVEGTFISFTPETIKTAQDLSKAFATSVEIQQKSLPKISIEKNTLYIGGKSSAAHVRVCGSVGNDLTLQFLVTSLKLKDTSCKKFYNNLRSSVGVSSSTVVANAILAQLTRATVSNLFESIRTSLIKQFDVNRVIAFEQEEIRATTSSGKYTIRSLSGIRNKIANVKTAKESQKLLYDWFISLNKPTKKHKEPVELFEPLSTLYQKALASVPEDPATKSKSSTPSGASEKTDKDSQKRGSAN